MAKKRPDLRIAHVNLFRLLMDYLKKRKLYERALKIQKSKGDGELRKALRGPLHEEKIAGIFVEEARPEDNDVVFMTGIGNVWPLFRSHTLLNNLHPFMQGTPLVVFYPGIYDGQRLSLFGSLARQQLLPGFQADSLSRKDAQPYRRINPTKP